MDWHIYIYRKQHKKGKYVWDAVNGKRIENVRSDRNLKQKVGKAVQQQTTARNGYYIVYLFTIGLFLGILIVNLGYDTWIGEGSLLGADMISRLKNSIPDGNSLLGYVLKQRLFTVCLLGLLATTMIGLPAVCGYVCYMGLSAGCLLSVAVIRYGIRGLFLMAAGIFPQGILLIPGYAALFLWAVGVNRMLYSHGTGREYYGGYSRQSYLKRGVQMAGIIAIVMAGCFLESYVNPQILQYVLKIF